MPTKDLRYYTYTIYLKSNAYLTDILLKWGGLKRYQRRNRAYFHGLYHRFFNNPLPLNPQFDGVYFTYTYFQSRQHLEPHLTFDAAGVAMCRADTQPYYNPLFPAHYGLVCYNDWQKTASEDSLARFWKHVFYLKNIGKETDTHLFFYYNEDVPHFQLKAPWYAGITQALVASLFLRAYQLTGAADWQAAAHKTLQTLFIPVAEKGVFCRHTEGGPWIEEYPSADKPNLVLNGFVFCLIGLYEYLHWVPSASAALKTQTAALTESLFKALHHYQWGRFTKYSLYLPVFQNIEYQGFMIFQWQHLYHLTGNAAFLEIRDRMARAVDWAAFSRLYNLGDYRAFTSFL